VPKTDLLQGTLDLLILKILTLGPNHGWGISNRIRQMSREGLEASQGSLYPALHRLELRGDLESEMTSSENNRRARVYRLTAIARGEPSPQLFVVPPDYKTVDGPERPFFEKRVP